MINVAVFASGSGTNAENIIKYFSNSNSVRIQRVFTNNPKAGVIKRASMMDVPVHVFSKTDFFNSSMVVDKLKDDKTDFIILAGFLLLVPNNIIEMFKGRIINIHPALLPSNGGKGFYGMNVHDAVIKSGAIMSGITIHHVNEKFDEGEIIFQAGCYVSRTETPESLAAKIHALEYSYFPVVIEKVIRTTFNTKPETA